MEKNEAHKIGEIMAKSIMGKDFVATEKPAAKYAYKIIGSSSEYFSCAFDNLAELFKDAEGSIGKENLKAGAAINVGMVEKIDVPEIDVDSLLEDMWCNYYDQYGEIADDYLKYVKKEHAKILSEELNAAFRKWAKQYRYEPTFHNVVNVVDYVYTGKKWELIIC